MTAKTATAKNVDRVLTRFAVFLLDADEESRKQAAERINALLDDLCTEDFFGTEAQCDPRGDQR